MELYAHERLSSRAEAEVLAEAVKTSYASVARVLGEDSLISKAAIMDKVHGIQTELPFPKPEKQTDICLNGCRNTSTRTTRAGI